MFNPANSQAELGSREGDNIRSPTLNLLKLFNASHGMRGPHRGAVLQLGSDQCFVCGGFELW
ncbi:hypothetical protein DPMN_108034 [Dreissena polymorpha]|uniref:Uncharacterized protein n=1 Tax=Dreissena polymorpha TaxID=45954 RepID=A0A9D4K8B5_DREPO|nr:hypothetical protein DPMN_108034 [Dreissena polymorpha]